MAYLGINVKVEISTFGEDSPPSQTVTSLTKANPGIASKASHGYTNGTVLVFDVDAGMVELDKQAVRVANAASGTFELEDLDTSLYTTWSSGDVIAVNAWETLSDATNVTMPNPTPAKIDITRLIDIQKQYAYGLPDAPDGSATVLFNPTNAAQQMVRRATRTTQQVVFRLTWPNNALVALFNANVSGGQGFDLSGNAAMTGTLSFTPVGQVNYFAT